METNDQYEPDFDLKIRRQLYVALCKAAVNQNFAPTLRGITALLNKYQTRKDFELSSKTVKPWFTKTPPINPIGDNLDKLRLALSDDGLKAGKIEQLIRVNVKDNSSSSEDQHAPSAKDSEATEDTKFLAKEPPSNHKHSLMNNARKYLTGLKFGLPIAALAVAIYSLITASNTNNLRASTTSSVSSDQLKGNNQGPYCEIFFAHGPYVSSLVQ